MVKSTYYNKQREKILLSVWLKTVGKNVAELTVYIKNSNKNFIPLRICAKKKTKEEIAIEKKRLKRLESKKQITYSEDTRFAHQFIFAVTSLPASVSAEKYWNFIVCAGKWSLYLKDINLYFA